MRFASSPKMTPALLAAAAVVLVAGGIGTARAQGGPPMVTDDPETPGDGKWEINLAGLGSRTRAGRWEVSVPDADINYGWGDRIQLKLDVPWTFVRESGERWKSGLGAGNVGVKWRFLDGGDGGLSMSTYPQYLSGWLQSSKKRGITSDEKEFFLPLGPRAKWAGGASMARSAAISSSTEPTNGSPAGSWRTPAARGASACLKSTKLTRRTIRTPW